jgi:hypothetical protein
MSQIWDRPMTVDYAKRNLQNASFKNENLVNTSFMGSDLRGADFSGADLSHADLTQVKTGITPVNNALILFVALVISLLSGYVAMLGGTTIQDMLKSGDVKIKAAGILSIILIVVFIIYYHQKGGRSVLRNFLLPALGLSLVIGGLAYFSGLGTGRGMFYLTLSLLLVVLMITIGTIARAMAGVLSSTIMFILVASGGSIFGSRIGGGLGSVLLAISCAAISRRALSGTKGFESLRNMALKITTRLGTSFRNANLSMRIFPIQSSHNADFTMPILIVNKLG